MLHCGDRLQINNPIKQNISNTINRMAIKSKAPGADNANNPVEKVNTLRMDGKRLFVDAPMTKIGAFGLANSPREWREIPFHHGMADAVIDLTNMRQLWPKCEFSRSELARFMTRVARQRYIIRGR